MQAMSGAIFSFRPASLGKFVLVTLHIDAHSTKSNALHAQAESLLSAALTGTLNRAAGTHDAMPGQSMDFAQHPHNLTGGARPSGSTGDCTIAGNRARRKGPNALDDPGLFHDDCRISWWFLPGMCHVVHFCNVL